MSSTAIKRTTATALAAVAIAGAVGVPAASARVPDAGPGNGGAPSAGLPDMHASTALAAAEARRQQDLRSADARDAAAGRGTFSAPDVAVVTVPEQPAPVSPSGDGIDWTDAGIGAGGVLAMILLATGGAIAVGHRRRSAQTAPTV